jgi:hypothetical protein
MGRLKGALNRYDVGDLRDSVLAQIEKGNMTQSIASSFIDLIEALPVLEVPVVTVPENRVTEAGYYVHPADGRTVKVQRSKKGYLYALELGGDKPKFVSGLLRELDATKKADAPAAAIAQGANPELAELLAQMAARFLPFGSVKRASKQMLNTREVDRGEVR